MREVNCSPKHSGMLRALLETFASRGAVLSGHHGFVSVNRKRMPHLNLEISRTIFSKELLYKVGRVEGNPRDDAETWGEEESCYRVGRENLLEPGKTVSCRTVDSESDG